MLLQPVFDVEGWTATIEALPNDNVKVGSAVGTNAPDDEELAVSFGIQNGEAVAKVMTLDYISAGKERTANTEL